MIDRPTDRVAAAREIVESVGGRMECFYWMQGNHDGFLIAEYKDAASAAAVAMAAASTGGTSLWESHELFDGAAQEQIMRIAKSARDRYKPPMA
jgi:uncharacterized protein with GYD domain